jgi:hypothetical protein
VPCRNTYITANERPRLDVTELHNSRTSFRALRRARGLLINHRMRTLSRWIVVGLLALAASCWSGKGRPQGTNVGVGSDDGGPWNQGGGGGGGTIAAVPRP